MITDFHIVNFRSIVDLCLDLTYGEGRAPSGYQEMARMPFVEDREVGVRCVPCLALFGANAAGKSNIMLALAALQNIIKGQYRDVRKLYDGNLIVPSADDMTTFELGFVDGAKRYWYSVSYGQGGVTNEQLKVSDKLVFQLGTGGTDLSRLEATGYNLERLQKIVQVECREEISGLMIRPLLTVLGRSYQGLNGDVSRAYRYLRTRLMILDDMNIQRVFPLAVNVLSEAMKVSQDEATNKIVSVVRKLDVDILNIQIADQSTVESGEYDFMMGRKDDPGSPHGIVIRSHHKDVTGKDVFFRFMKQESEGTKRLATIVGFMLAALEEGELICIDEFDWALHPLIVQEMLGLFKNPALNRHGAQLMFTTHMTDLLEDRVLRVSEACFVHKNLHVGTKIKRLVDFKADGIDLRNSTNFRRLYLQGAYQSIPHPAI